MLVGVMHRFAAASFVVFLVEGSAIRAEPVPGTVSGRVVTLDEALLAVTAVPDVVAARANERAAAARIELARTPAEPALTFETHSITARESLALSLPFRWGGQRATAVKTAEAERDTAVRSGDVARASARRAVRVAWFTLAAGEDRLRAATEQLARAERNRAALADLLSVGRASRLDAARATTEAATATANLAKAEQAVVAASGELRALLGVEDPRLSAGGAKTIPPHEGDLESWRDAALQRSPELALATSELHTAEATVAQRERDRLPTTSLEAGADWNDPTQPGTDAKVGLGITIPTRSHAALDVAHADQDRATALLALARRRAATDIETAWSATRSARLRFEALDGLARPAAAEAAEMTRVGYTEGRLDLFRLLDAERALNDAERDRADAYQDWGIAFADLERLAPEAVQ